MCAMCECTFGKVNLELRLLDVRGKNNCTGRTLKIDAELF